MQSFKTKQLKKGVEYGGFWEENWGGQKSKLFFLIESWKGKEENI